jgi:hypothetical protein
MHRFTRQGIGLLSFFFTSLVTLPAYAEGDATSDALNLNYIPIVTGYFLSPKPVPSNAHGFIAGLSRHTKDDEPQEIVILIPIEFFEEKIGYGDQTMCLGAEGETPIACSVKVGPYARNKQAPYAYTFLARDLKLLPNRGIITVTNEKGEAKLTIATDFGELRSLALNSSNP